MKCFRKRFLALLLTMVMVLSMGVTVFATQQGGSTLTPYQELLKIINTGEYTCKTNKKTYSFISKDYKKSGGGYAKWTDLTDTTAISQSDASPFVGSVFDELTSKSKQEFVSDTLSLANAMAYDSANGYGVISGNVTDETVQIYVEKISNTSGMGSTLLASLLQNTKPDYVAANRIYEPFSGVVGTILGVVSVLIMALLGVTMALDLAYITIPAVQMALGGDENTNQGGGTKNSKGLSGLISTEAKKACEAASGGSGGQAGQGEYKAAVGIYFKYRWKGLTILVICLLYLVQGEIYSFIGWFIDLFSGFLGG